jgi:hypothetical protein
MLRHAMTAASVAVLAAPGVAHALPVLNIDAPRAIPSEPKIGATLRMPGYRGRVGIETRGQSSQQFPKKSFAIELRDARGEDRKVPLLAAERARPRRVRADGEARAGR